MVGIMSLMPALLGMAMADILNQLPVAQRVKQALTDHGGLHGDLLHLAESTEQTDPEVIEEARNRLPGISENCLGDGLIQALSWANNLVQTQSTND